MRVRHLLLTLGVVLGSLASASAQTAPALVVVEPVKDAGVVPTGELVQETFLLRNDGTTELRILSVEPDCGCTVVSFDRVIGAGQTGKIIAEVDVANFVGPIAKFLSVRTNDAANPQLSLTIKAEVRPELQSYPSYARFLTVVGEGEMRAEQTVWASDFDDLRIRSARTPYKFLRVQFREATEEEERSEGSGRQWRVVMTLSADAPIGPMANHVRLTTNHPKRKNLRIPVSGFVRPVLAVSPPVAQFGHREGGQPIVASVHVKNFSDDEIHLLRVTSDRPEVEVEIKPDEGDHYLIITVQPGAAPGPFSSLLTVQTDSSRIPTLEVQVKGTIL